MLWNNPYFHNWCLIDWTIHSIKPFVSRWFLKVVQWAIKALAGALKHASIPLRKAIASNFEEFYNKAINLIYLLKFSTIINIYLAQYEKISNGVIKSMISKSFNWGNKVLKLDLIESHFTPKNMYSHLLIHIILPILIA